MTDKSNKKILIYCRKAPYANSLAREAIDIALAMAVFEQQLTLLFSGEGVWQLVKHQQAEALNAKNQGKLLSAITHYDLDQCYVDGVSLTERQLSLDDLVINCQSIDHPATALLLENHQVILNF